MLSVVAASYNRAALLDRALQTYAHQTLSRRLWEYVLIDDQSEDDTAAVVQRWQNRGLPVRYFTSADVGKPKAPGVWRDGATLRNAGSTFAFGRYLVMTHPEILLPPTALAQMVLTLERADVWATAIPYWLPPCSEAELAERFGMGDDLTRLHTLPGFYDAGWPDAAMSPGVIDYRNQTQERRLDWESEVFWGLRMATWRAMGGFRETTKWGSVDMDFLSRRRALKIGTRLVEDPASPAPSKVLMVYHQFHDSPRDMDAAFEELKGVAYPDEAAAVAAGGLTPSYSHGHREREGRDGILRDHVIRYEWVAGNEPVGPLLDIPCGTGYGAMLLATSNTVLWVTAMDLDEESLDFAAQRYRAPSLQFVKGDLANIPLPTASVRTVTCFEGLEHVPDPALVLAEIHRVLQPKGRLYLSTPQRGVAHGTPWDRYMLTHDRLVVLLASAQFDVDVFHQQFYGGEHPVRPGYNPRAEIMLALATKPY